MIDLTFRQFQRINVDRCDIWHGEGENWLNVDWSNAIAGEAGELCNIVKKIRRLETNAVHLEQENDIDKLTEKALDEIADVVIYCGLAAHHFGADFEEIIRSKFNRSSEKFGFKHRI